MGLLTRAQKARIACRVYELTLPSGAPGPEWTPNPVIHPHLRFSPDSLSISFSLCLLSGALPQTAWLSIQQATSLLQVTGTGR